MKAELFSSVTLAGFIVPPASAASMLLVACCFLLLLRLEYITISAKVTVVVHDFRKAT